MTYMVFNATDGVYAAPEAMTRQQAEEFVAAFKLRFAEQGYYLTASGERIPVDGLQLHLEESDPRVFVESGQVVRIELPFSEVCMHMLVAGTVMSVRLEGHMAQLLRNDGRDFSAPITAGEAGFYFEEGRYYCYPVE